MSILSAFGLSSDKKIRYAIVGLGDISQEAMMPGVAHTGNSEIAALVTSDAEKAGSLGEYYGVTESYDYSRFDELLHSGKIDAIYLATPNWRHAEFAIPALQAGIHVLVEKPLETTTEKCRAIMEAAAVSTAKLMVAYRLHFEPATLSTLQRARDGDLGDVLLFTSTFTQSVSPDNHRAQSGIEAGPLFDMGPYPINAARMLFGTEPTEVISAVGARYPKAELGDFDHTVAVTLRFPGERIASFVVSYVCDTVQSYDIVGTQGSVRMSPAYMYGKPLEQTMTTGEDVHHKSFKNTDHFGGEMKYFSDCLLNNKVIEPDAEEGYADVRVLEGIVQALISGRPCLLSPFTRRKRVDVETQEMTLAAQRGPDLVHASNPGKGVDKVPKN